MSIQSRIAVADFVATFKFWGKCIMGILRGLPCNKPFLSPCARTNWCKIPIIVQQTSVFDCKMRRSVLEVILYQASPLSLYLIFRTFPPSPSPTRPPQYIYIFAGGGGGTVDHTSDIMSRQKTPRCKDVHLCQYVIKNRNLVYERVTTCTVDLCVSICILISKKQDS